jgi:hypothetical protein
MTRLSWVLQFRTLTVAIGSVIAITALPAVAQLIPINDSAVPATPATPTGSRLVPLSAAPTSTANFSFTNVLQYSDCLSAILDLYQGNIPADLPTRRNACTAAIEQAAGEDGLSQIEARQLVSAADFYSNHFLAKPLYPPKGLRLRVAQLLGYVYQIDQNDPEVLSQAAQS